jgi:hypothetical protein
VQLKESQTSFYKVDSLSKPFTDSAFSMLVFAKGIKRFKRAAVSLISGSLQMEQRFILATANL